MITYHYLQKTGVRRYFNTPIYGCHHAWRMLMLHRPVHNMMYMIRTQGIRHNDIPRFMLCHSDDSCELVQPGTFALLLSTEIRNDTGRGPYGSNRSTFLLDGQLLKTITHRSSAHLHISINESAIPIVGTFTGAGEPNMRVLVGMQDIPTVERLTGQSVSPFVCELCERRAWRREEHHAVPNDQAGRAVEG